MKIYDGMNFRVNLLNAFSVQMLATKNCTVEFFTISEEMAKDLCSKASGEWGYGFNSFIGHQDTANVLSNVLGVDVPVNRANFTLHKSVPVRPSDGMMTVNIIAQLTGGRLPEGSTCLPEGFEFEFVGVVCTNAIVCGADWYSGSHGQCE